MYYSHFDILSADAQDAVIYVEKARIAYEGAKKAAIRAVITEVLGDEWTAKQFHNHNWRCYGVVMPSLKTLLKHGDVTRRVEEIELPMETKKEIATTRVTVTLDNGLAFTVDSVYESQYVVGQQYNGACIVEVAHKLPEFKGHRYIYRLA